MSGAFIGSYARVKDLFYTVLRDATGLEPGRQARQNKDRKDDMRRKGGQRERER